MSVDSKDVRESLRAASSCPSCLGEERMPWSRLDSRPCFLCGVSGWQAAVEEAVLALAPMARRVRLEGLGCVRLVMRGNQ